MLLLSAAVIVASVVVTGLALAHRKHGPPSPSDALVSQ